MIDIKQLLKKMTLKEKIGQMVQITPNLLGADGAITGPLLQMGFAEEDVKNLGSILGLASAKEMIRIQKEHLKKNPHNIPLMFMHDVIHGYRTIFPIPLAIGCSWDTDAAEKCAEISAIEAEASGITVTFSPMVDLVRDSRWGRVMESTGEDPFLNSLFAKAFVRGYQGNDIAEEGSIAACVKHFAGYGATETGKDYDTVDMSERMFREFYLPSYKAAIDEGCKMVMTSFNLINSVPASGNVWLMREVLRKELGFDDVLISDWDAIREMIPHGYAEDNKDATHKAVRAGVDIDMCNECYLNHIEELVGEGKIDEALIDETVLRILNLKEELGLFENPYKTASVEREKELHVNKKHREAARDTARKSIVLLKNEDILPLNKTEKIALVGPFADNGEIIGNWSCMGKAEDTVTLKEGMERRFGNKKIKYAKAYSYIDTTEELAGEVYNVATSSDVVVLAIGEHQSNSGEAKSRAFLKIPDVQVQMLKEIKNLGKRVISVIFAGRPLELSEVEKYSDAVLYAWQPGTEGGNALADIISGDYSPTARLTMSFPYTVGQSPIYYNHFNTGRPKKTEDPYTSCYIDAPNEPLYPFGYGLAYTSFEYSEIDYDGEEFIGELKEFSVNVKNTGNREGSEVVQLYIRDVAAEMVRPVKELKAFERVSLEPGEEKEISFFVTKDMLKYIGQDLKYRIDPGKFEIFIGPNSRDVKIAEFWVK